jgi:hypothetical protein
MQGGFPPGVAPYGPKAAQAAAEGRLRTGAIITTVGGALLFMISFLLLVVTFAIGGAGAAFLVLLFGLVPGIAILVAGTLMMRPGANVDGLVVLTVFCAVISLFSLGGFLIGAILSFVGAAIVRSAARDLTARAYAYPPPPAYSPLYPPPGAYSQPYPPPPPAYAPVYAAPPPAPRPAPTWPMPPPPSYAQYVPFSQPLPAAHVAPPPPPPKPAPPPPPPTPIELFLSQDPDREFDLEALNVFDYDALATAANADRSRRSQANEKAESLQRRLMTDVADINTLDDILRDRLVLWYRDSPHDPLWGARQPDRFAGLVAESRTAGGARTAALTDRIGQLREATAPFEGPARRAFKQLRQAGEGEAAAVKALPAQTVQAVLDDIAATPRTAEAEDSLPLLRLSELAVKASTAAVNTALADLFKADARGPFVILHPSRFPDFEFVLIRPPPPRAAGAAIAYELVCAPPSADPASAGAAQASAVPGIASGATPAFADDPWSNPDITLEAWAATLTEFERRRDRLPAPASDFRRSPAYFTLRKLVVDDPSARRTFLAVKWRGKPPGIGLLAQLLADKQLTPEVETDAEYLDAELSDIERGDPNWRPASPAWTIAPGVHATRTGDHGAFVYRVA